MRASDIPADVSSSSGDERATGGASRRHRPDSQQRSEREQQLTHLLARASEAIRKEREKVSQLEAENDKLSQKLSAASHSSSPAAGSNVSHQSSLRQKVHDLALENFIAIEEIAKLRLHVRTLTAKVSELETKVLSGKSMTNASPQKRSQSAGNQRSQLHMSADRKGQQPSPQHYADPHDGSRQPIPVMLSPTKEKTSPPRATQASSAPSDRIHQQYNDVMISRLRRAMAPQPTKEQLGEVVHAMVSELVRQMRLRGQLLSMKRLDHGVYQLEKKKIHLTVDSGKLVVKCGGGHVDFLEYLERGKQVSLR